MKAEKRGNSWRVRVLDYTDGEGKRHFKSFTAPTKAEVLFVASQYSMTKDHHDRVPKEMTVGDAVRKYIELKSLLAETTTDSYTSISKYAFADLMQEKVNKLTDSVVQIHINKEAKRPSEQTGKQISAKTVKNEWTLISGALKLVCHREFYVTLPKYQKHEKEYPDPEDVIRAIVGSPVELPCMLAVWTSFRMAEVRGIMCSDVNVDDSYINIKETVVDTRRGSVRKGDAKTEKSLRKGDLTDYLWYLIQNTESYKNYLETGEDQPLITMSRNQIYGRWQTTCRHNGFQLSFHDLRHYAASIRDFLEFPFKLIQDDGGWKTDVVVKKYYTHPFEMEKKIYHAKLNEYFEEIIKSVTKKCDQES